MSTASIFSEYPAAGLTRLSLKCPAWKDFINFAFKKIF